MSLEEMNRSEQFIFPSTRQEESDHTRIQNLDIQTNQAVSRGIEYLFSLQRQDSRWCAELESNLTITSEYVFLYQMLGLEFGKKKQKLIKYFQKKQNGDGSWSKASLTPGDLSITAEAYLALRILGLEKNHQVLLKAEEFIKKEGGIEKIRIFTRIFFAMFGLFPWDLVPVIPPEFILLPKSSSVNIYSLSSWARGTMVPLFIISHHKPVFSLPQSEVKQHEWLDHLWLNPNNKRVPYNLSVGELWNEYGVSWKTFFGVADHALRYYEQGKNTALREIALQKCTKWVLDHQEKSGDWAGIFPPMINGILALKLQGYSLESDPIQRGLKAIESFAWEDPEGLRIQACNSPVWDTVLSTISLIDSRVDPQEPRLKSAMQWVLDRQLLVDYGDWKVYRPDLVSGGWAFEYFNSWYPDVDDSAAVVIALLKQNPQQVYSHSVTRALEWILGMQNRDGGWAAFDVDNDHLFLNEIPFSDMDSLCDPSSPDIAGRVLEAFGIALEALRTIKSPVPFPNALQKRIEKACERGKEYLRKSQEVEGAWFGRWGVNYIYGTSNVLCGLARVHVPGSDPMVKKSLEWLKSVQNSDGGWGESVASYADQEWMGKGESTPSQTAWALMGLLGYIDPNEEVIHKGVQWLIKNQTPAVAVAAYEGEKNEVPKAKGWSWNEVHFTGTGFPNHFYLKYHLYRHYFPMMALGRYLQSKQS